MYLKRVDGPRQVTLPDGSILTRADLPPADTRRWVASRKAVVVKAVVYGLITADRGAGTLCPVGRRIRALARCRGTAWREGLESHGDPEI